jgi:hypothetical protein
MEESQMTNSPQDRLIATRMIISLGLLSTVVLSSCGGDSGGGITVPGAPTNVAAAAAVRSATVSWSAPASNGGGNLTGYTVIMAPTSSAAVATVTGTSATVSNLANATAYTFAVTAANAAGTGPASLPSAPVTTPDVPGASTGVTAVAGSTAATLSWTAPSSNGGSAITGYSVTVSPVSPSAVFTVTGTTATVAGLTNGTAYSFQILASNAVGNGPASASSNVVTPLGAPTSLAYSTNPASYTVGVAIPPNVPSSGGGAAASYSVTPSLPAGLGLNAMTGVISGTPTAPSASATYTVRATNGSGFSEVGLVISVASATKVVLISWNGAKESGVNKPGGGYRVNISGRSSVDVPFVSGSAAPTSMTVPLPAGTYTVTVSSYAALDARGGTSGTTGAPSQAISVTVP